MCFNFLTSFISKTYSCVFPLFAKIFIYSAYIKTKLYNLSKIRVRILEFCAINKIVL